MSTGPDLTAELDAAEAIVMGGDGDAAGSQVLRAMRWLVGSGYEVVVGSRKADGAEGFYAALEHLDLAEPEEFYGDAISGAVLRAHAWAAARTDLGGGAATTAGGSQ